MAEGGTDRPKHGLHGSAAPRNGSQTLFPSSAKYLSMPKTKFPPAETPESAKSSAATPTPSTYLYTVGESCRAAGDLDLSSFCRRVTILRHKDEATGMTGKHLGSVFRCVRS